MGEKCPSSVVGAAEGREERGSAEKRESKMGVKRILIRSVERSQFGFECRNNRMKRRKRTGCRIRRLFRRSRYCPVHLSLLLALLNEDSQVEEVPRLAETEGEDVGGLRGRVGKPTERFASPNSGHCVV
jgi:hypothetical protein